METFIFDWWWRSHQSLTLRFTHFQILCYALERWIENPTIKYCLGRQVDVGSKCSSQHRALDTIDGEPMEFEWNISQDSPHCSSATKVQEFLSKMSEEPEEFTVRIIFMSMFNDITWRSKDNEQEFELSANLVSIYARFSPGRWSFLVPGSEKKWYSTHYGKPQG